MTTITAEGMLDEMRRPEVIEGLARVLAVRLGIPGVNSYDFRAVLDAEGNIVSWYHRDIGFLRRGERW